jgi:hypothetical protein
MSNETKHTFASLQAYKEALDKSPNSSWIKKRSLGAKSSTYIPIEVKQALSDRFFDEVHIVEEKYQVIFNEILCTVKLMLLPSYPNSDYITITGTGAVPIQSDSGSPIEKFPRGKKKNAVEYCAPKARTAAISNALTTIGNIFGRNLGRAVSAGFNFSEKKKKKSKKNKKK